MFFLSKVQYIGKSVGKLALWSSVVLSLSMALSSCHSSKSSATGNNKNRTKTEFHLSTKGLDKVHRRLVEEAMEWMGTPYAYGCQEKGEGTDCSGMVLVLYRDIAGVMLPRNSAKQAEFSKGIKKKDVKTGDLVFFATGKDPDRISHVGIMLDEENFIHASTSKGVVISQVSTPYYIKTFKKYGRVL